MTELETAISQRHDFIKEYYKMATVDLDRHLKAGWQTIAVLAGGVAILTAGHDGKLGIPLAAAIALGSSFWGAMSVIDANFWSLRAIAFLSNVEAVYFSVEDRAAFNKYIGRHPPYSFLNSLKYMFSLCVLLAVFCFSQFAWEIVSNQFKPIAGWASVPVAERVMWLFPIYVVVFGTLWTIRSWCKYYGEYLEFCTESPGPGVRLRTADLRSVLLRPIDGIAQWALEPGTNDEMLSKMSSRLARWTRVMAVVYPITWVVTIVATIVLLKIT